MSRLNYIPVADVYNSFIVNLKTQVFNEKVFELKISKSFYSYTEIHWIHLWLIIQGDRKD